MDPNDNAKYLNSPETELFDKSSTLYNYAPARQAAGQGKPLIVAEGYMDVIALAQAGFDAAVAPLGTAVTETQLQLLWRVSDEPVMALDGDRAGVAAARRVVDLALPLLEAGKSLRFALMPDGKDPDDILRSEGAGAVRALLEQAQPMVDLLWQRETEGRDFDSPERKAALDKSLRAAIARIADPSIRGHYGQAIKDLRWQLFTPRRAPAAKGRQSTKDANGRWVKPDETARATTKSSDFARTDPHAQVHLREAVILAALISTPAICAEFEAALERLECRDPLHGTLRDLILTHAPDCDMETLSEEESNASNPLRAILERHLGTDPLERLMRLPHVAITPPVRRPGEVEPAQMTVAEELAKITAERGLQAEIVDAAEDLTGTPDEAPNESMTWRLGQAVEARNRAVRSQHEDRAEYDFADNGARINRGEREQFDALLDKITFTKPRR